MKSESEAHESEVYVLKRELVEKRIETERMKERLTASEEAREEIAKQLYELSGQRKKVEEQAQELDRLRERLQQAEQRAKELKTRADALEQAVSYTHLPENATSVSAVIHSSFFGGDEEMESMVLSIYDQIYSTLDNWITSDFMPNLNKYISQMTDGVVKILAVLKNFFICLLYTSPGSL